MPDKLATLKKRIDEKTGNVINTRVVDGVHTPNEYQIDWIKTVAVIFFLIPIGFLIYIDCNLRDTILVFGSIMAGSLVVSIIFVNFLNLGLRNNYVLVNRIEYREFLNETHDLVYELHIKPSNWQRHVTIGNVMNFHAPQIVQYGENIKGDIHIPWADEYRPDGKTVPMAFVRDKDDLKRAFEEFKLRYAEPNLTGRLLHMIYKGQRQKELRFE